MISFSSTHWRAAPLAVLACLAWEPALAQEEPVAEEGVIAEEADAPPADTDETFVEDSGGGTDIFSADTLTLILDGRLVLADGSESWVDGGFGKTRFDGTDDGDLKLNTVAAEAALIWQPRFTRSDRKSVV